MIKRRFYKIDHGDRDGDDDDDASSLSSSSSSSDDDDDDDVDLQEQHEEEHEDSDENENDDDDGIHENPSREEERSGYESEECSGEIDSDASDGITHDDLANSRDTKKPKEKREPAEIAEEAVPAHLSDPSSTISPDDAESNDCVIKIKSVYKCRLCPRILCLSDAIMKVHLQSKKHRRSVKLLKEGRLKLMLNSDGEIEEEAETHAERYSRIMAAAQSTENSADLNKENKRGGRQRQRERLKRKKRTHEKKAGSPKKKKHKEATR